MRRFMQVRVFGVSMIYWLLLTLGLLGGTTFLPDLSAVSAAVPARFPKALAQIPGQIYTPQNAEERAVMEAFLTANKKRYPTQKAPTITRLVTSGQHAMLDWIYSQMGGQVVLTKKSGQWQVIRGVGGALNGPTLQRFGLSKTEARDLLQRYQQAYPR